MIPTLIIIAGAIVAIAAFGACASAKDTGCGFFLALFIGFLTFLACKAYWYVAGDPDNPDKIVLAGRISQSNQRRWLNNRLVLVFAQEREAGRATTQVGSFRSAVTTPTDGVFTVALDNPYSLRSADIPNCKPQEFSKRTVYCWLGEFREDSGGVSFTVPHKKLDYAVKFLPGDAEALPEEMKEPGITGLAEGNIVIVASHPQAQGWFDKLFGKPPAAPPPEPVVPNLLSEVRYDPKIEEHELPSQAATASLDNCRGSDTVRQSTRPSKASPGLRGALFTWLQKAPLVTPRRQQTFTASIKCCWNC
jgi:hypothetical protein